MLKHIIAFIMAALMVLSLGACGTNANVKEGTSGSADADLPSTSADAALETSDKTAPNETDAQELLAANMPQEAVESSDSSKKNSANSEDAAGVLSSTEAVGTTGATSQSSSSQPSESTSQSSSSQLTQLHIHSYTATVIAPTCTNKGYTEHKCSCGDSYKDSYKDALGHNYVKGNAVAATCTAGGYTSYKCSRCGSTEKRDQTNALGHSWDSGKVTREATTSTEGIKTYTCTKCGTTKTESIPKLTKVYYDIQQAIDGANKYLASLGYTQNYNATPSNAGYFPPEAVPGETISALGGQTWLNNLAIEKCSSSMELGISVLTCYGFYKSETDEYWIYILEGGH